MKVKCLNSSSLKTRDSIKKAFALLINEKKDLTKITVKALVAKAGITRSTFYTHYTSLEEVAKEYETEAIDLLCNENILLETKEDIINYFNNIIKCLKENESTYKLLISTNDSLFFLEKLKRIASEKIYNALKNFNSNPYLELDVSFFMSGICTEIIKYFREYNHYTLDELLLNIQKWFKEIFP